MNEKQIKFAKKIARMLTSYGSGVITYGIIRNNVSPTRIDKKIAMGVAAFALGGAVAKIACEEIDRIIDDAIKNFREINNRTAGVEENSTKPVMEVVKDGA